MRGPGNPAFLQHPMQPILPKAKAQIFAVTTPCVWRITGNIINLSTQRTVTITVSFSSKMPVHCSNFSLLTLHREESHNSLRTENAFLRMLYSGKQRSLVSADSLAYLVPEKKTLIFFHTTKRMDNFGYIHCIPNNKKSRIPGENMLHTCL